MTEQFSKIKLSTRNLKLEILWYWKKYSHTAAWNVIVLRLRQYFSPMIGHSIIYMSTSDSKAASFVLYACYIHFIFNIVTPENKSRDRNF